MLENDDGAAHPTVDDSAKVVQAVAEVGADLKQGSEHTNVIGNVDSPADSVITYEHGDAKVQPSRKPRHRTPMATDEVDSVHLDGKLEQSKLMVTKKKEERLGRRRKHPNTGAAQVLAAAHDSGETPEKKKIK